MPFGKIGLFFLAVCLGAAAGAEDGPRVIWPVEDFPPAHVIKGEFAGTGLLDQEIRYLTGRLGEFTHKVSEMSNTRAWAILAEQDGVCISGAIDTPERRKFAVFSRTSLTALMPQILIRTSDLERFSRFRNAAGEIELSLLGAAANLRAARPAGRPLGRALEDFARVNKIPSLPLSRQYLSMLDSGRLDYALGYTNQIVYYRKTHPGAGALMALKVAGVARILYAHVACSNGVIGRRVVARVDAILGPHGEPPYFQEASRPWYEPADLHDLISQSRWP